MNLVDQRDINIMNFRFKYNLGTKYYMHPKFDLTGVQNNDL